MRILAIRGENLASLRRFEVDLDDPDGLGPVGLFAITGPTGAGKSTLLDALCLALYDKTPRFAAARSQHRVGRDPEDPTNLGAGDVRNILRRGAGAGFAEVDFVGRDAGQYRARWAVHRAHGRAGNRMQNQTVQLTDLLDGQPLSGGTKKETLALIEELAGLSFDQFRRSVLLAQGDFDAFLRADEKERGALLERMTGTEIYRQLSVAAHERHREARAEIQRLGDRLASHPVLSAAARRRLDAQLAVGATWTSAAKALRAQAEADRRWHLRQAALEEAVANAEAAERRARDAWEAAAPRRARVELTRRAAPLQPLVAAADRAASQTETRQRALAAARDAAAQAQAQATEADRGRAGADDALAAARAAMTASAADLEAARTLDARLEAARASADHHATAAQTARAKATAATARWRTLDAARAREAEALQVAEATGAALATVRPLVLEWASIRAATEAWLALRAEADRRAAAADQAAHAARAADDALIAARAKVTEARALLEAKASGLAGLDAEALAHAADTARAAEHRHAERARDLDRLCERAGHARRLIDALGESAERLADARAQRTPLRRTRTAAERRAASLREDLEAARAALQLSRAAEDLVGHRARLKPGEPCPICGATAHPGIDPALIATDRFAARVEQIAAELAAADEAVTQAEKGLAAIAAALEAEERSRARLVDEARIVSADWAMARMGIGSAVPEDPSAEDALPQLQRLRERAREQRDAAADAARAAQTGLEAHRAARAAVEGARAALAIADAAVEEARLAADDAHRAAAGAASERAAALAAADRAEVRLAPLAAVTDLERIAADPIERLDRLARDVAQVHAADRAAADARASLAATADARAEAHASADAAATSAADAERIAEEARQAVARLAVARGALFGGEPSERVSARLTAGIERAHARVEAARAAQDAAVRAADRAEERVDAAAVAAQDAEAEARAAADRLSAACQAAGLDASALQALHDLAGAALAAEEAALAALQDAVARAHAVVAERAADQADHEANRPAADAATADARWARANAQYDAILRAGAAALAARDRDDAARAAHDALEAERSAAEAVREVWGQLDALIGSADGAAFREFAQSLTLDAVVHRANHHLRTLARRYQLMRVPGENLALQIVDRHMGDEVRTVKSLSGGETFLVSLSLALGLATLSARDTRIESLFIDEGFGTLDADTLDIVIDALDALQAQGRQIGLISHVPGLAQRIGAQVCIEPTSSGTSGVTIRRPGFGV